MTTWESEDDGTEEVVGLRGVSVRHPADVGVLPIHSYLVEKGLLVDDLIESFVITDPYEVGEILRLANDIFHDGHRDVQVTLNDEDGRELITVSWQRRPFAEPRYMILVTSGVNVLSDSYMSHLEVLNIFDQVWKER